MGDYGIFRMWEEDARTVYSHLQDEESRKLFDLKNRLIFEPYIEEWISEICSMYKDWIPEPLIRDNRDSIVIYGTGHDGMMFLKMLRSFDITPKCFCETEPGKTDRICNIDIYAVNETLDDDKNIYLIASDKYRHEMYHYLREKGVGKERIYIPEYKYPMALRGNQYFDLFTPGDEEIFVDAGAYNGDSIERFITWSKDKMRGAYAIEPDPAMCEVMKEKFVNYNFRICRGGAWQSNDELRFSGMDTATHMDPDGEVAVKGIMIDDLNEIGTPTFIKMDIEGVELNALRGASRVIRENAPRLAICVYHKPNDIVELGKYILDLVPEYKFWIRQYTSLIYETVLYASV